MQNLHEVPNIMTNLDQVQITDNHGDLEYIHATWLLTKGYVKDTDVHTLAEVLKKNKASSPNFQILNETSRG